MADLSMDSMLVASTIVRPGTSGSKFKNGDTLLARITPCLENGKTGYVNFLKDGEVGRGSTEFIVMRSRRLTPEYVYCYARTYHFREHAIKSMIGSSGRQRVQVACFTEYPMLVPPTLLLDAFSDFARPCFEQIRILARTNEKLREARDLLLPRLMSGEIIV
jgi:type I restriction enzyme S subunit